MEQKELNLKDIPMGYPLCFNSECTKKDCCMHYQARLLMPDSRYTGSSVFPTAWQNGACKCFREKQLVRKAWGFTHLYDNIPQRQRAEARESVHAFFGRGNGPYYRAHHGELMLSPKQQDEILKIIAKFGSTNGIHFNHYVTDWDFDY